MAQIFVSHSKHDTELVNYFSRLGARTHVKMVFEELENIVSGAVAAPQVRQHITESNALFVLLSKHVQNLPHTRDWVVWEAGVGHNKDIWVMERASDVGSVSVVTPFLRHYLVFEPIDAVFGYLSAVVQSYDDSNLVPAAVAGAGLGALFGPPGALVGAFTGAVVGDTSRSRPQGIPTRCGRCLSTYGLHLPKGFGLIFRCPVCNQRVTLQLPRT